jgi:hypothetical protein
MSETLDYSFWIVWTGSRYKVSIPNYEGGAVIPIKHYQDLLAERDALKAELAEAAAIAEEIGPLVYDSLYLQVRNNQEAKEFLLRDPRFQKAARFLEKREAQP